MMTTPARTSQTLFGVFMMLGFAAFGPTIDVFAKLAGEAGVPVFQVSGARFAVQVITLLPFALFFRALHLPDWQETGLYLLRGGLILVATTFFFASLVYLPIADAISIFFIEPFVLTLLGALLLGETIGWRRIFACLVGFFGALLVIQPQYQEVGIAAAFPLGTAVCFALYLILTRQMTQKSHALAIQIYTSLAAFLLIMPILLIMNDGPISSLNMIPLSAYQISLLIGVGIAASIAHMFITVAFRHAPVAVLAPLQYLEIITATLFGWWIFGDLPNKTTYVGIAIIVSSGLYVLMREHKVSKEKPAQATGLHTPPPP